MPLTDAVAAAKQIDALFKPLLVQGGFRLKYKITVNGPASPVTGTRPLTPTPSASRGDSEAFIEGDLDFHLALAEAAANPLILSLIDSIVGLLREHRFRTYYVEGGPERGQYHHKRILRAVEHRDTVGAREAMRSHLRQVREDSSGIEM